MGRHNKTGQKGEEIAEKYLEGKGYSILERNWRNGQYEIDIIAAREIELIIVEVKTRHSDYLEAPINAVNKKKQGFLIKAANAYIRRGKVNMEVRFDIVTVVFHAGETGDRYTVDHTENAFYPLLR